MREEGLSLEVKNLTVQKGKLFRGAQNLLYQIDFSIKPGEFVAIVGPNGAGKTTLLKSLTGEKPFSGEILLNGNDLYTNPQVWLKHIGYVPVDNILHEGLTVWDALLFSGRLRGLDNATLQQEIPEYLRQFEIQSKIHTHIHLLSSGEKKRVNICAELLTDPPLLLLDEPTSNLDPYYENRLMELLKDVAKEQQKSILVISHTTNGLKHCDKAIFFSTSKIVGEIYQNRSEGFDDFARSFALNEMTHEDWIELFEKYSTKERNGELAVGSWHWIRNMIRRQLFDRHSLPENPTRIDKHYTQRLVSEVGILLKRQGKLLLWQELFFVVLLSIVAGLLLLMVIPPEALIETEKSDFSIKAGFLRQATFFIALVIYILGLLVPSRSIVREIDIYLHERANGLRATSYLLSKIITFGFLYGVIMPSIVFGFIIFSQKLPDFSLFVDSRFDVWLIMILVGLASVSLGILISSISKSGNFANTLLGVAILFGALLTQPVENKLFEAYTEYISKFVPSRWGMEGLGTITGFYCWDGIVTWELRDHFSVGHLVQVIIILVTYFTVTSALGLLALLFKDHWLGLVSRTSRLINMQSFVIVLCLGVILIIQYPFSQWISETYDASVNEGVVFVLDENSQDDSLNYLLYSFFSSPAAQCKQNIPEPVPGLAIEEPIDTLALPTIEPSATFAPVSTESVVPSSTPFVSTNIKETEVASSDSQLTITPSVAPTITPLPSETPTSAASPTPPLITEELQVEISSSVTLHYAPFSTSPILWNVPANSQLTLLSRMRASNASSWIRAQYLGNNNRYYFGWVEATNTLELQNKIPLLIDEQTVPPSCAIPVASTYSGNITNLSFQTGKLGQWVSDSDGEVVLAIDILRPDVIATSTPMLLEVLVNEIIMDELSIAAQQKERLVLNHILSADVKDQDILSIVLTPTSNNPTLETLNAHITIFFVPSSCRFD